MTQSSLPPVNEQPVPAPGLILDRTESAESRPVHARPGECCPACGEGILDYDGLLNLVCPVCRFFEGGCYT